MKELPEPHIISDYAGNLFLVKYYLDDSGNIKHFLISI